MLRRLTQNIVGKLKVLQLKGEKDVEIVRNVYQMGNKENPI